MKPCKIIFLSPSTCGDSLKFSSSDEDVVFVNTWAGLFARRLKKYRPTLNISCWSMEQFVKEKSEKKIFNIDGIIWPFKFVIIKNILSLPMYFEILKTSFKHKVILHYHNLFDCFILIRFFLPPNVKIILSHHGGLPPRRNSLKDFMVKFFYKYITAITFVNPAVKDYLIERKVNKNKLFFLPVGADFNFLTPGDKVLARKKIGLDQNCIYAIYVGKFYRLKSVDLILEVYKRLKNKYNFKIIFVGGDPSDELYEEVKNSGCPFFFYQEHERIPTFYQAADFYLHPAFNPTFGGLDVSWMEALACNIPVLTPQLKYFNFDHSELGVCLTNPNEVFEKTEFMINNFHRFTKCREIAQVYLDGNIAVMKGLEKIYENII